MIDTVLATPNGQDYARFREVANQLRVVRAFALVAIAATDKEEARDVALLDLLDDRRRGTEDRLVPEADHDLFRTFRPDLIGVREGGVRRQETLEALRGFDDWLEVNVVQRVPNVGNVLPAHSAGRKEAVAVPCPRTRQAVRRHENGTGEVRELNALSHPRSAEVANKVLVLLQLGVRVRWQHLSVRVDIDAKGFRLLQQGAQDDEVVARHQNALAGNGRNRHRCGGGDAQRRVAFVQERHRRDVCLTCLEAQLEGVLQRDLGRVAQCRKRLMHELVDGLVLHLVHERMVRVRGDALQAVHEHLTHTSGALRVGVREAGEHADSLAFLDKRLDVLNARVHSVAGAHERLHAFLCAQSLVPCLGGLGGHTDFLHQLLEASLIEVDVGQRREGSVQGHVVGGIVLWGAEFAQVVEEETEALHSVNGQVLQPRHLGRLPAYTDLGAPASVARLLALEAEHLRFAHAGRKRVAVHFTTSVALEQVLHVVVGREELLVVAVLSAELADVDTTATQTIVDGAWHGAAGAAVVHVALRAQERCDIAGEVLNKVLGLLGVVRGAVDELDLLLRDHVVQLVLEKLVLASVAEAVVQAAARGLGVALKALREKGTHCADAAAERDEANRDRVGLDGNAAGVETDRQLAAKFQLAQVRRAEALVGLALSAADRDTVQQLDALVNRGARCLNESVGDGVGAGGQAGGVRQQKRECDGHVRNHFEQIDDGEDAVGELVELAVHVEVVGELIEKLLLLGDGVQDGQGLEEAAAGDCRQVDDLRKERVHREGALVDVAWGCPGLRRDHVHGARRELEAGTGALDETAPVLGLHIHPVVYQKRALHTHSLDGRGHIELEEPRGVGVPKRRRLNVLRHFDLHEISVHGLRRGIRGCHHIVHARVDSTCADGRSERGPQRLFEGAKRQVMAIDLAAVLGDRELSAPSLRHHGVELLGRGIEVLVLAVPESEHGEGNALEDRVQGPRFNGGGHLLGVVWELTGAIRRRDPDHRGGRLASFLAEDADTVVHGGELRHEPVAQRGCAEHLGVVLGCASLTAVQNHEAGHFL
eukprot:PhM_4_TR7544/c0_g1_i1/m.40466